MRVFWPRNCFDGLESHHDCLIVGWKDENFIVVVTALPILDLTILSQLLERDILLERGSAGQLYAPFQDKRLTILGSLRFDDREPMCSPLKASNGWLEVISDGMADSVRVYRNKYLCPVILFDPPNPEKMHYFTLHPAGLYKVDYPPLKYQVWLDYHCSAHGRDTPEILPPWSSIIAQMNCVHDLSSQITRKAREIFPELREDPNTIIKYMRRRRTSSVCGPPQKLRGRSRAVVSMVMSLRNVIDMFLTGLEKPMVYSWNGQDSWSLRDIFCTFQQLHLRLNQLCYLPHQYIAIVGINQRRWHYMTPQRNEAYIRFYNMLWLAIYDWILGSYFYSLLHANEKLLSSMAYGGFNSACDNLVSITRWLMSSPAGFKLNTQLAQFMGEVIIWSIIAWKTLINVVLNAGPWQFLLRIIAFCGILGGAALQLSLVIDVFYLLSLQMWILYQSLARVYRQHLGALGALFRLFRGKKFNALRNRVDSGNYDMNELLMGTIFFTVLLFLLPTVLAFYLVLAIIQFGVLSIAASLGVALAVLNYFPLFPVLLRIRSPQRLPSGVKFRKQDGSLLIQSRPMRVSEIFSQLSEAIMKFVSESFNPGILKKLAFGDVVRVQPGKVYKSLYSVLPSQRGASSKLLEELDEYWE